MNRQGRQERQEQQDQNQQKLVGGIATGEAKSDVRTEPDEETDQIAHQVVGAAIEVHRILGPGFLEAVYEEALCVELALRGVAFARQNGIKRIVLS